MTAKMPARACDVEEQSLVPVTTADARWEGGGVVEELRESGGRGTANGGGWLRIWMVRIWGVCVCVCGFAVSMSLAMSLSVLCACSR